MNYSYAELFPNRGRERCMLMPVNSSPITVDQQQPLTPNDFLLGSTYTAQTPVANRSSAQSPVDSNPLPKIAPKDEVIAKK
ncbi:unnamed protein product [Ceratitis capitata]|uniref:(Mediterranean fruit fly) hypothetical protein n=1 Tax=Ceratitis capitata TaxID=7213 RepID=A0A811UTT3_CERCA|nr:unnamed protein product [Ceratitis capitata]